MTKIELACDILTKFATSDGFECNAVLAAEFGQSEYDTREEVDFLDKADISGM